MFSADGNEFADFFTAMTDGAQNGELRNSFIRVLIPNLLWPFLIFLFSFSIIGIAAIPICVFAKGFLISYSASAIIRAFGESGIWFALISMGIPNLIYIPLLILVSLTAVRLSTGMDRIQGIYAARFAIVTAIFTAIAAHQAFIQPKIITWLLSGIE
jgi:stage II sporulation protein M